MSLNIENVLCNTLNFIHSVNVKYVDQNGESKLVQGKVGDNVMYLAHRHNIEIEGICDIFDVTSKKFFYNSHTTSKKKKKNMNCIISFY